MLKCLLFLLGALFYKSVYCAEIELKELRCSFESYEEFVERKNETSEINEIIIFKKDCFDNVLINVESEEELNYYFEDEDFSKIKQLEIKLNLIEKIPDSTWSMLNKMIYLQKLIIFSYYLNEDIEEKKKILSAIKNPYHTKFIKFENNEII
jgi:hypothetical protein